MSTRKLSGIRRNAIAALAVCLLGWSASVARAHGDEDHGKEGQTNSYSDKLLKQVRIDQGKLNSQVPVNLMFRDETGKEVRLGSYLGDKPAMVLMLSYACTQLCAAELEALVYTLKELKFTPGKEFNLLVASIDPQETVAMARGNKDAFMEKYQRPAAAAGVHFLTGDAASIKELTAATGYHYVYDKVWKQWIHPSAVVMLTPDGKVGRYFLKLDYSPRDLRYGLIESSASRIGSPVDYFVLSCGVHYSNGKYTFAVEKLLRAAGVLTLLVLAVGIVGMMRRDKNQGLAVPEISTGEATPLKSA
ncbi:MAG TPA: SCO family protein [Abditibacteriaceae bacterium]|jgi:protein SCO1/2